MSGLSRNNPFPRASCGRSKCPLVSQGLDCGEKCYSESIIYQSTCNRCINEQIDGGIAEPVESLYVGETSRTLFTRTQQHIHDYRKAASLPPMDPMDPEKDQTSSWMWDHASKAHDGPQDFSTDYTFTVLQVHRDPLTRQIGESVRITKNIETGLHHSARGKETHVKSLNRKGEQFAALERWNPP